MAETKKRLGRGLNSLLSSTRLQEIDEVADVVSAPIHSLSDVKSVDGEMCELPIDIINRNPHQPRQNWDDRKMIELAESIKANGLIQPIIVRPMGKGYQLIVGERRLRASQMAERKAIQAIVRHASEEQMLEWALIENIHRADLTPLERAGAYKNYIENFSLSHKEAAGRLSEDRSTIANYMRLLELPDEIKHMLNERLITMGHARALLAVTNKGQQLRLAKMIVIQKLSVRELERKVQNLSLEKVKSQKEDVEKSPHILELEQEMTRSLGTKVSINPVGKKGHRGKIIIEFYNLDDFDRIRDILQ